MLIPGKHDENQFLMPCFAFLWRHSGHFRQLEMFLIRKMTNGNMSVTIRQNAYWQPGDACPLA